MNQKNKENESAVEWQKRIEKEISELQKKLSEKDPQNPLLEMVKITSMGIDYDFGGLEGATYTGKTIKESFEMYLQDLKETVERV